MLSGKRRSADLAQDTWKGTVQTVRSSTSLVPWDYQSTLNDKMSWQEERRAQGRRDGDGKRIYEPMMESVVSDFLYLWVKAGPPPLEAILVIFGRRALIFLLFESSWKKNEKWHNFCAHAQWWSPWRRKNVEKGHLAPLNLTFLLFAIETVFRRMKEGQIYETLPQIF